MELTLEEAKKLSKKLFFKMPRKEVVESLIVHTKTVAKAALILAKRKNIDKNSLEISAWLHDVGYSVQDEGHAKFSLELVLKEGFKVNDIVRDCLLNHGSSGQPITEEGKILQKADKMCVFNPEFLKLLVKYNKGKIKDEDKTWIKKMCNGALQHLDNIEV